jgi:hypothetical protein
LGAWGHGSFDNDMADDWAADLARARTLRPVVVALKRGAKPDDADDDDADSQAIAAAEVVASLRSGSVEGLPEDVAEWVAFHPLPIDATLQLALAAVRRIGTQSALRDLWEDDPEWLAAVAALEARLLAPAHPDAAKSLEGHAAARRAVLAARVRPREADLLWVPLGDGHHATGIVLHVSRSHPRSLLIGFFRDLFTHPDQVNPATLAEPYALPVNYVSTVAVEDREWPVLGNFPELRARCSLPLILHSDGLYRGDERVEPLSPREVHALKIEDPPRYQSLSFAGPGGPPKVLRAHLVEGVPVTPHGFLAR